MYLEHFLYDTFCITTALARPPGSATGCTPPFGLDAARGSIGLGHARKKNKERHRGPGRARSHVNTVARWGERKDFGCRIVSLQLQQYLKDSEYYGRHHIHWAVRFPLIHWARMVPEAKNGLELKLALFGAEMGLVQKDMAHTRRS
jgi:hypothetical protein